MEELAFRILAIDALHKTIFCANGTDGEILWEINYPKNYTITELTVDTASSRAYLPAVDTAGHGKLFCLDITGKTLNELPLELPHPLQFTLLPEKQTAYLVDAANTLHAINLASMTITAWGRPEGENIACVGLTAGSSGLYTAWEEGQNGMAAAFDLDGNIAYQHELPGIPTNIILADDEQLLIPFTTADYTKEGLVIIKQNSKEQHNPAIITTKCCLCTNSASPYAIYPSHAAIAPDRHTAYIVNEESASLTVCDLKTAQITGHIQVGRSISYLHILPGGKFALASSHMFADLCLIDLVNGKLLSTTNTNREILGYIAVL
jgi:DNA-binding beta-propeller fold protein YncE